MVSKTAINLHYGNKYSYEKYHHYLTLLSLFMLLGILKLQAAIQLPPYFPTIWCYNVTQNLLSGDGVFREKQFPSPPNG